MSKCAEVPIRITGVVVTDEDLTITLPGGKEKQRAILRNWSYDGSTLYGNVYSHPRLPDGLDVRTSHVLWIDKTIRVAETLNTVYILEGPEQTWPT